MGLRETLDTSILKLSSATETKIVEFAAEDSWRGTSNNLKVIVPAALSHVCRNSRWSWESATKQLHNNVGKVVRLWRPSWGEVQNDNNRWRRCVVDWTVSYAEHQFGSRRRSTDVCGSRQVVRQQACRPFPLYSVYRLNGASTCIIV